jgi:Na+-driven multidrug efflux pump
MLVAGANQPHRARLAQHMGMALNTVLMTAACVLIYVFSHQIGAVYTDDEDVLAALNRVLPFISLILWGTPSARLSFLPLCFPLFVAARVCACVFVCVFISVYMVVRVWVYVIMCEFM